MTSNSQFTEMFLEWPLSKIVSEWGLFDYMNINKFLKTLLWNYWSDFEIIS